MNNLFQLLSDVFQYGNDFISLFHLAYNYVMSFKGIFCSMYTFKGILKVKEFIATKSSKNVLQDLLVTLKQINICI